MHGLLPVALVVTGFGSSCLPGAAEQKVATTTGTVGEPAIAPSTIPTLTPAAGPRAAKIIFKAAFPAGSFDAAPASGTPAVPGSGLKAMRVFNADGSLLAQGGPTAPSWPKWLSNVEIGISGANNSRALNKDCARFGGATEDTSTACSFGPCGVGGGVFRVSEYDCVRTPADTAVGNGGPSDGVYIRASFSRNPDNLNPSENVMAVIEYAASGLSPAPVNPTTCFTGGTFSPGSCADQLWQIFLKHDAYEVVQPFLMLVPPNLTSALGSSTGANGAPISSKQIFIPLAGDGGLSVMQISRIMGIPTSTTSYTATCNGAANPSNSALCVGMVIYSITFFRI